MNTLIRQWCGIRQIGSSSVTPGLLPFWQAVSQACYASRHWALSFASGQIENHGAAERIAEAKIMVGHNYGCLVYLNVPQKGEDVGMG